MKTVKCLMGAPGGRAKFPMSTTFRTESEQGALDVILMSVDNNGTKEITVFYKGESFGNAVGILIDSHESDELISLTEVAQHLMESEGNKIYAKATKINARFYVEYINQGVDMNEDSGEFAEEINRIVGAGILSKEEVWERIAYLIKCRVSTTSILDVLGSYRVYPEDIKSLIKVPKTLYVDSSGIVASCISYANCGANLLFEGDRGVGKNVLTETLSWVYNRPLFEFAMNSQHDNSSFLGSKTFEDALSSFTPEKEKNFFKKISSFVTGGLKKMFTGKDDDAEEMMEVLKTAMSMVSGNQKITFEPSTIIKSAMYGGILVIDEVNTALGHAFSVFNTLLDERRRITVEGFKDIEADKNFFAIGTMNKDYRSTFELNEALEDRFEKFIFDSNDSIAGILRAKVPSAQREVIEKCDMLYKSIVGSVISGDVDSKAITIRGFINAVKVVTHQGHDLNKALTISVINKVKDYEEREAIRSMLFMMTK